MDSAYATFLILLAVSAIRIAYAQSTHLVTVGDRGSFYDPPDVVASKGDTVTFRWTGMFHSVTQTSFASPCVPLPGGFDSGVTGNVPGQPQGLPEWNLTITDDTQPIWFFCKVTMPVSHCTSGMVGAINADPMDGNQSYAAFLQKAKALTNPPTLSHAPPALTGVGASSTSTPAPLINVTDLNATAASTSSTSTSTSTSATIVQVTQSPTTTPVTSGTALSVDEKGAIAGGIVGGVILVTLVALLFTSYQRARRYRKEAQASKILHSQSSRDMFQSDRLEPYYRDVPPEPPSNSGSHMAQFHRSQGSASVADSLEQESAMSPGINIKELAAEIAKNMREGSIKERRPDGTTLDAVPEQVIVNAISRATSASARVTESTRGAETGQAESIRGAESPRGAESTRTGDTGGRAASTRTGAARQLPRPPSGPPRSEYSIDTLPAYFPEPRK